MLSIIIVNYKSTSLVLDALHSVWQFNPGLNAEVIIVDNASGDGGREIILAAFPMVRWIQLEYNAGFARANNAGMKEASGDAFLLLNPDTLAIDDSISRCYEKLIESDWMAAGVQILDSNKLPQISGSYFMQGGLNHLLPLPYWGDFLRWLGYRFNTKVPNVPVAEASQQVDWISGAFLMVKKQAVEIAGLMDEDFFLYAEEVEWCSRLRKSGKLGIFGDLHIIHLEGATIDKESGTKETGYYNLYDKKGLQLMVSNHLRVRKHYGVIWFLFLLLNYTFTIPVFFIAGFLHYLFTLRNPFTLWARAAAFTKNVASLWLLVPKIISGKPYFYKMF